MTNRKNIFLTEFLPPIIICCISLIIYITLLLTKAEFASPSQVLLYMGICLIPMLIYVVSFGYIRLPHALKIGLYAYFTASNLIATAFNLYSFIPFFDTILHTLFGYLCGYLIIYIYKLTNDYDNMSFLLKVLSILLITAGIGAFWEICEYSVDVLTNANSQHEIETGLIDTMQDTFCNICGAFVFSLHMVIDHFALKDRFFNLTSKAMAPIGKLSYNLKKEDK